MNKAKKWWKRLTVNVYNGSSNKNSQSKADYKYIYPSKQSNWQSYTSIKYHSRIKITLNFPWSPRITPRIPPESSHVPLFVPLNLITDEFLRVRHAFRKYLFQPGLFLKGKPPLKVNPLGHKRPHLVVDLLLALLLLSELLLYLQKDLVPVFQRVVQVAEGWHPSCLFLLYLLVCLLVLHWFLYCVQELLSVHVVLLYLCYEILLGKEITVCPGVE